MEAGRTWERDGIANLRNLGFDVRRFGQEKVFDTAFVNKLQQIVPHCRIRNLPDAIAVSGNLWFLVDFKSSSPENSKSKYWAIGCHSLATMASLSSALKCKAYFYFSDGTAICAQRAASIITKDGKCLPTDRFVLIDKSHCSNLNDLLFPKQQPKQKTPESSGTVLIFVIILVIIAIALLILRH